MRAAEDVEAGYTLHNCQVQAVMSHTDIDAGLVVGNRCVVGLQPFDYAGGDDSDWCSGPSALVGHIMATLYLFETSFYSSLI